MSSINTDKLLVLDMDGVVNGDELIHTYIKNARDAIVRTSDLRGLEAHEHAVDLYLEEFGYKGKPLEAVFPKLAAKIKKIIDETDAYILWSTTWRLYEPYKKNIEAAKEMLTRRGIPGEKLIGYTPDYGGYHTRVEEINSWLANNEYGEWKKVAVLDDVQLDCLDSSCKFFRTNSLTGITTAVMNKVIRWLNE